MQTTQADIARQTDATGMKAILAIAAKNHLKVLVTGAPGVGKTVGVFDLSKQFKTKLFVSHPAISDPTDYKGFPMIDKHGNAKFVPFGDLKELIDCKVPAWFVMDDMGQATGATQAALMQLINTGRVNGHVIGKNILFIGLTNRQQDKSGVSCFYDALRSRFSTVIDLVPSIDSWIPWAIDNKMPYQLIGFVQSQGIKALWDFKPTHNFDGYPNPRSIEEVGKWLKSGLSEDYLYHPVISGCVGYSWTETFKGFMRIIDKMIDPREVIKNPETAEVPSELDRLCAICSGLSSIASDKNFDKIVTYANRFEDGANFPDNRPRPEFSMMVILDSGRYKKSIKETHAWIKWWVDHKELAFDCELGTNNL